MPLFTCKLGTPDGTIVQRELEAVDEVQLRAGLEGQGYHVFALQRAGLKLSFNLLKQRGGRIDNRDLLAFNQELVVLLKSGMPILPVLDAILEHRLKAGGALAQVLGQVREDVKGGAALSTAFERHGRLFPPLYLASVRAGERTGEVPQTIRRYIVFLKRSEELRKKLISALVYPAILVVVAVLAIMLLLIYVVPTFSQVYADAGSQLPLLTRLLINFTGVLRSTVIVWLPLLLAAIVALRSWSRSEGGRQRVDRWKLALPVVGDLFFGYAVSVFSRTLATLLGSGIPIVESLRMSSGTLNNRLLEKGMAVAIHQVEEGGRLSVALEQQQLMPPLALRMLGVGEATGSMEEMLSDIAEHLEAQVEERLQLLSTAIEPAVMLIMGLVIGVIIVAMYLPIFKLAGTVGG